jgi:hypothetical protein
VSKKTGLVQELKRMPHQKEWQKIQNIEELLNGIKILPKVKEIDGARGALNLWKMYSY